jgi:hypothetical protein
MKLNGRLGDRLPDFYRHGKRYWVEVSWPVDHRSVPQTSTGRFRYPIGYPQTSHKSQTGHGFYFSAPIVSDTERHGPAWNDQTNQEVLQVCNRLLIDVVARHLVPRWGPRALKPLIPVDTAGENPVREVLAKLAKLGGIPVLSWRAATIMERL